MRMSSNLLGSNFALFASSRETWFGYTAREAAKGTGFPKPHG
jgi:hypothetical protein